MTANFDQLNRRAAATFLQRLLGTDDALAALYDEAKSTNDTFHADTTMSHLENMERALADFIDYSRRLEAEIKSLQSRQYARQMGRPDDH